jgi:hypothetical protein
MFDQNLIVGLIVIAVAVFAVYTYYPNVFRGILPGSREHFANAAKKTSGNAPNGIKTPAGKLPTLLPLDKQSAEVKAPHAAVAPKPAAGAEGFADYQSGFGGDNMGTMPMVWAQVNPTGAGDIQGKNFLSAGALIGVNTVGQSLRNPNLGLRAEPPCPQIQGISPWMNSTIEPDLQRRPLE